MSLFYHVFLFSLTAAFWMAQNSAYEPLLSYLNKPIVTFLSSFIGDAFHKRQCKERVQTLPVVVPEVVHQNLSNLYSLYYNRALQYIAHFQYADCFMSLE